VLPRWMKITDVLRYGRSADALAAEVDGYLNYHFFTSAPDTGRPRMMLEAGINPVAAVKGPDGLRRPVIAIRSSPWKAGHESNPWHDEFDLDHGHVRYYGDHKPSTSGMPGATLGNKVLLEAWRDHAGTEREERLAAAPMVLFRSRTVVSDAGRKVPKGHVEFCGVAVIERLEYLVQRDPASGRSFPNLVIDFNVVDLSATGDRMDWRWIDDRRDPSLTAEETLQHAPVSWKRWVEQGNLALPSIRRRIVSSRVQTGTEQRPPVGSAESQVLTQIYDYFNGRKHQFEHLAARVAAEVLRSDGFNYVEGWLTRAGGDGGLDFVGRLDVGTGPGSTPMIVLGQAKCIDPNSGVSPDQVARVVARLQRGWIGVYVTTGVFSRQAQIEIIDDRYPLVLIAGGRLAEVVRRLAYTSYGGDIKALLAATTAGYAGAVTSRRPEEVLYA